MLYRTSLSAPVFGLRREIDRLFEDTFGRDASSAWTPSVDVRENQNEVRIDVELPGIKPDDVEITAENGVLTIRGEKHTERKEDDEDRYHVIERSYGSFMRSFQLPQGLDENRIEATADNGILSVHIPKSALPQPKKVQIKTAAQSSIGTSGQQQIGSKDSGSTQKRTTTNRPAMGDQPQTRQPMAAGDKST